MGIYLSNLNSFRGQYVYLAQAEYRQELCDELGESVVFGDLILSPRCKLDACFAQDIWINPRIVRFNSISDAAKILNQFPVFWQEYRHECVRRTVLIKEKLHAYREREWSFPIKESVPAVGSFTLLDQNTLLFSPHRWKSLPQGLCQFVEDKKNPPNRAYLKLWEALTLLQRYPTSNDVVLDLGASPGGWSYVMQQLGARVIAVDKAELAPSVMQLPRIEYRSDSAFSLEPEQFPEVTWFVADIACYPERLFTLVQRWLEQKTIQQMICTIKLQGKTDFESIQLFQNIPNSRVLHLFNNKHEVTFFHPAPNHLCAQDMQTIEL